MICVDSYIVIAIQKEEDGTWMIDLDLIENGTTMPPIHTLFATITKEDICMLLWVFINFLDVDIRHVIEV